jgi:hypothetical protein
MLKGTRDAIVKKIQPVSIHGQISLDVYFVTAEDPEGQVSLARVGPEAMPRNIEPGDLVTLHYMLGVVTSISRQTSG